jgi:two-component system KDP operon response regulator KdpE
VKALLIEESPEEVKRISCYLQVRWPQCTILSTADGSEGAELAETESPDLVILDVSSNGSDGLELVTRIRSFSDVPLVILTEKGNEVTEVAGLEMGADDYVTKPINAIELLARLGALLRRVNSTGFKMDQAPLCLGSLKLDFTTREVFVSEERVKLTPIEYDLLSHLVRNEGKVLTHSTLLERVWGRDYVNEPEHVKKYVYRLRSKLKDNSHNPKMLLSERGIGYRFVRPV